ncbi:MAG: DNA internalization-related competence protein ComEC/Rec2 [Candidatus Eremiobacteraeota bacterium]|nr:DNA internalization-related competence protein ComEC/Rec2 [Candidatus Eremiobacteraeota bacterium]
MARAYLAPLAAAFVGGIVAELRGCPQLALALAAVVAAAGSRLPFALRLGLVACAALGALDARERGTIVFAPADVRTASYAATVLERAGPPDAGEWLLELADGRRVTAVLPHAHPSVCERLTLRARFEPPDQARNPGEPSPREFAAERGLAGRLLHAHLQHVAACDRGDVRYWLPRLRAWAGAKIRRRLDEPFATILAGAMWGERGSLPPDLRAEFQDTGTVHILVTAGLHLGVVAALASWMLGALGAGRAAASLGAIALVWPYALFSGAHLPSVRAATMVSFALFARAVGRSAYSWNAWAAAAIVVSALRPSSTGSLSFALSFSCVGAILLFAEPLTRALEGCGIPDPLREALALTFATQIGTWPLTAYGFLVFAPYAPLANALVVPAVGLAMLLGFLLLAASPIPLLAQAIAALETSVLAWIVGVVRFAAGLPGAHVVATPPPVWSIALYDVAACVAAALLARGRYAFAALILCVASALCVWPPRPASHDLTITAIDVGQADAILIQTPSGRTILVDAGGRLERGTLGGGSPAEAVGERVVVPFLVRHGTHHVDAVILSHPHGDHAGGVAPVLRSLGADRFADGGQTYAGHAYHDALDVARVKHIPMTEPRAGDDWSTGDGVTFRFYGPAEPFLHGTRNDINSNSVVFMLEYRCPGCRTPFRMLFTGDAGAETERRLLASGFDLHADVLKVGHHGSAYSSSPEFVRAVSPRYAIVSVGKHNLFGHPAPRTIDTLARAGATIYRTDERGAIVVHVNGETVSLATQL